MSHDEIIERLLTALDNSTTLLTDLIAEGFTNNDQIEAQISENRAALDAAVARDTK
jgi:hypothetical protein